MRTEEQPIEPDEEYEEVNGKRMIYRSYSDTEIASLWTNVKCPYCGHEDMELDMNDCGEAYTIECEACGKEYGMYFDA